MTSSVPTSVADLDMSMFVVRRLDRHLHDLRELRDRMRTRTTIGPGDRLALTRVAVTLAEGFASELEQALRPDGGYPPPQ